jgi:hypothetical protein
MALPRSDGIDPAGGGLRNCSPSTWLVLDDYAELNLNGKLANLFRSKPPISETFGRSNAIQLVVPSSYSACYSKHVTNSYTNSVTHSLSMESTR